MTLQIKSTDIALRVIRSIVYPSAKITFSSLTMLTLPTQQLTFPTAIATELLKDSGLLGRDAEEQAVVFQASLEINGEWKSKLKNDRNEAMNELQIALANKTFWINDKLSMADLMMYGVLYDIPFMPNDLKQYPNVIRYFDLLQHVARKLAPNAGLDLLEFDLEVPFVPKPVEVAEKKSKPKEESKVKKETEGKPKDTKKSSGSEPTKLDKKIDPSKLDIRVGKVLSVSRHPDAESLYVESIDVGESEPRTVVSGLVQHMPESALENQLVVLLCNLKPAKMRGIESSAMVLCATSSTGLVELLVPPPNSKPGEVCKFSGFNGEPETLIKSKQKIWENIQPLLVTNEQKEAIFKGEVDAKLTTPNGVVTVSSVINGSIK